MNQRDGSVRISMCIKNRIDTEKRRPPRILYNKKEEFHMGQKDMAEKLLEDYPDVFADIINVLVFQGERRVREEDLYQTNVRSQYKADGQKLHEQERDNFKVWINGRHKILLGIENQTKIDRDMPLRVISYDGAAYREQILNKKESERSQVMTVVLYFGEEPWKQPRSLKERIPQIGKLQGNDYKLHVFEIAFLTEEQISMFQSDFGIVAEFFVKQRKKEEYHGNQKPIRHVDAVLKFMSVFAKDERFLKLRIPKEDQIMSSKLLDRIEEEGKEIGKEQTFQLVEILMKENKMEEMKRIQVDAEYYDKLLKEYHII